MKILIKLFVLCSLMSFSIYSAHQKAKLPASPGDKYLDKLITLYEKAATIKTKGNDVNSYILFLLVKTEIYGMIIKGLLNGLSDKAIRFKSEKGFDEFIDSLQKSSQALLAKVK